MCAIAEQLVTDKACTYRLAVNIIHSYEVNGIQRFTRQYSLMHRAEPSYLLLYATEQGLVRKAK